MSYKNQQKETQKLYELQKQKEIQVNKEKKETDIIIKNHLGKHPELEEQAKKIVENKLSTIGKLNKSEHLLPDEKAKNDNLKSLYNRIFIIEYKKILKELNII